MILYLYTFKNLFQSNTTVIEQQNKNKTYKDDNKKILVLHKNRSIS